MARIRSVHPELCRDETLATASANAERTFVRLWPHLDDEGRAVDHPKLLAADLYPLHDDMDAAAVDRDLAELAGLGLLVRYEHDAKRYLSAKPGPWRNYQRPQKPRSSSYPAPPDQTPAPPLPPRQQTTVPQPLLDQDATGPLSPRASDTPAQRPLPDQSLTTTRLVADRSGPVVGVGVGVVGSRSSRSNPLSPDGDTLAPEPDDGFDAFWDAWPKRNGKRLERAKAERSWARLKPGERDLALTGARHYAAASDDGLAGAMDAFRWLRDRLWPEWQEPAQPNGVRPFQARDGPRDPGVYADGLRAAAAVMRELEDAQEHAQKDGHKYPEEEP